MPHDKVRIRVRVKIKVRATINSTIGVRVAGGLGLGPIRVRDGIHIREVDGS